MNEVNQESVARVPAGGRQSLGLVGGALLLAGLLLCWAALVDTQLFRDEANLVAIARVPGLGAMLDCLVKDGNTPLYPVLIRILFSFLGTSDRGAQWFSVACFVGSCVVLFRWTATSAGRPAGLCALAGAVFGGIWLETAIQVRPYALLVLCTTVSLWMWQGLVDARGRVGWRAVLLWISATASLYTHPWAVFSVASMGGISLAALVLARREARVRWAWGVGSLLAAGVAWLPLFLVQWQQAGENLAPWSGPASWESVVLVFRGNLMSLQLLAAIVLVDAAACHLRERGRGLSVTGGPFLMLAWLAGVMGLAVVASWMTTCWASRYAVITTPALLFLVGGWAGRMWEGRGGCRRGLGRGLVGLGLATALGFTAYCLFTGFYQKTNSRDVARAIMARWKPGDVVVVSSFAHAPSLAHYLPSEVTVVAYPHGDRGEITRWRGIGGLVLDPSSVKRFQDLLLGRIRPGMRVWLVDPFKATLVGYGVAKEWIPKPTHSHQFNYMEVRQAVEIERWLQQIGRRVAVVYPDETRKAGERFTVTLIEVDPLVEAPR